MVTKKLTLVSGSICIEKIINFLSVTLSFSRVRVLMIIYIVYPNNLLTL